MNNLTLAVQMIKDSVSALDMAQAIGLDVDQHGRCACPFHKGKDRNLKLYPGDRGFSCFVCHESGDVIRFVMKYYNVSFPDSVRWFNGTFHLGMNIDSPMSEDAVKQAENAQRKRTEERAFREWKERMRFDLALTAEDIVRKLEQMRDENRPRTYGDSWNEAFCTAVRLLPEARRFADETMMDCMKEKEDGH